MTKIEAASIEKTTDSCNDCPKYFFCNLAYFPQAMILQFMGHIFQLYMCVCVVLGLSASFRYTVVPNLLMVLH